MRNAERENGKLLFTTAFFFAEANENPVEMRYVVVAAIH
jgi:hypothetical protein